MVGMASSVTLILFMSDSTDRAIDGKITNIRSSKCLPQSLLWKVGFHCNLFMFCGQSRKRVLFWGMNAYSIHWQTHLHNYMQHNTLFYTFNKNNIEHVTQMSVWRLCLLNMTSLSEVFRRFSIKGEGCVMLAKQVFKPL